MKRLLLVYAGLVALDAALTLWLLQYPGAVEQNPILAYSLQRGITGFLILKLLQIGFTWWISAHTRRPQIGLWTSIVLAGLIVGINVYGVVILLAA